MNEKSAFLDLLAELSLDPFRRLEARLNNCDPISAWCQSEAARNTSPPAVAVALISSLSTYLTALIYTTYPAEEGQDLSQLKIVSEMGQLLNHLLKDNLRHIQKADQKGCDVATEMLRQVVERHAGGKFH